MSTIDKTVEAIETYLDYLRDGNREFDTTTPNHSAARTLARILNIRGLLNHLPEPTTIDEEQAEWRNTHLVQATAQINDRELDEIAIAIIAAAQWAEG